MAVVTVWDQMESLLDHFGFRQYGVDETSNVERKGDMTGLAGPELRPMTILELVRCSVGVPRKAADFPVFMFWQGNDMRRVLDKVWSALNTALRGEDSAAHEIVSWCHLSNGRGAADLRAVIRRARSIDPQLSTSEFAPRPMSSQMFGAESVVGAAVNLFGIVRITRNVSYGDLLSSVLGKRKSELQLIDDLENMLSAQEQLEARCDNVSPIPQLLSRSYFASTRIDASQSSRLGLCDYIAGLDETNNLAGLSDTAFCKRLLLTFPASPKSDHGTLPQPLQKKIAKFLIGA